MTDCERRLGRIWRDNVSPITPNGIGADLVKILHDFGRYIRRSSGLMFLSVGHQDLGIDIVRRLRRRLRQENCLRWEMKTCSNF